MIQPIKVPELNIFSVSKKGISVGAAVSIQKLESELKLLVNHVSGKINYKIREHWRKKLKTLGSLIPSIKLLKYNH